MSIVISCASKSFGAFGASARQPYIQKPRVSNASKVIKTSRICRLHDSTGSEAVDPMEISFGATWTSIGALSFTPLAPSWCESEGRGQDCLRPGRLSGAVLGSMNSYKARVDQPTPRD